jgi:hypothetical protein
MSAMAGLVLLVSVLSLICIFVFWYETREDVTK